ncbi:6-pyruvoyl tetrahydrobiopterin synthase [Lewinellaceae bacterium SD302]|nr:6-pyruvoyl tetrahydrobiopterin synthase [Lewinellaceae bacterium SD302]
MKIAAFRRAHFNAAHRLFRADWSDEKNREIFGPCSNPFYHGHNYEVEVKVVGEIDPETGFVIDLSLLKRYIKEEVEDYLDHKNLNEQIPEFKDLNPTAEHICILIWNRLKPRLDERYELTVRLWETERNYVEYPA